MMLFAMTLTRDNNRKLDFQSIEKRVLKSKTPALHPTNRLAGRLMPGSLSLPLKNLTHPLEDLMEYNWYKTLETFLFKSPKKEIVLLSSNTDFLPVLLNWLAAFKSNTNSTLEEVLILAMDSEIHELLVYKGFNSIRIRDEDIFVPNIRLVTPFSHIWIKRCTVARIANHYGYDVMMFDLDAVVLKDIASLMAENIGAADIVGSKGKYPFALGQQWGFTLCMGVVLFRSTDGTGQPI